MRVYNLFDFHSLKNDYSQSDLLASYMFFILFAWGN